jgi:hypothetical protein
METREPEAPTGPDDDPQVPPTTEGPGSFGERKPQEGFGQGEEGGRAHTSMQEGHPAGEGERSTRDVGGPTSAEGEEGSPGTPPGGRGDIPTKGFEAHE